MTLSATRGGSMGNDELLTGKVITIHPKGFAFFTDDASYEEIYCPPWLVKDFKEGDTVEYQVSSQQDGRDAVKVIVSVNGEKKLRIGKKILNKAKKILHYIPSKARTRLYLAFTAGSSNDQKMLEMLAGAQESLAPYLNYAEQSIKAAERQRETLRFNWSLVEEPISIKIVPQYTRLETSIDCFDYLSTSLELNQDETLYAEGNDALNKITQIGSAIEDGRIPFNTQEPLEIHPIWKRLDQGMASLDYVSDRTSVVIDEITVDEERVEVLKQSESDNRIILDIGGNFHSRQKFMLNGSAMSVEIVDITSHGILKDTTSTTIVRENSVGGVIEALSLPSSDTIYDGENLPYSWNQGGGRNGRTGVRIKLEVHPEALSKLNKSEDDDPLDIILSPNREVKFLEIEGRWNSVDRHKKLHQVKVRSRDSESRTIRVNRLPDEGAVLTSAPRTRMIRAQRDMIEELKLHSLPHNRGLLNLLASGSLADREKIWQKGAPRILKSEPNWMVLTGNADGTEMQKEMVRVALSSRDFSILQGPPGSGKTTTILEIVLQKILEGENVLLCGSTQASIDNVLIRILNDPRFSEIVSPVRIGSEENIYDEEIQPYTLAAQKRRLKNVLDLSDDEAEGLVFSSSNLTCGTMEGILGHPWIRETRMEARENEGRDSFVHKSPQPHWDTLIIDECSKTTFNEFIVPAMFCRRFILVGDIRQLPPYTQEDEFKSNLENIKGFGHAEQRALLLNFQLGKINKPGANDPAILLVERSDVVRNLVEEWAQREQKFLPRIDLTIVMSDIENIEFPKTDSVRIYSSSQVNSSFNIGMDVMSSEVTIIDEISLNQIQHLLPRQPIVWGPKVKFDGFEITSYRSREHTEHRCFKNHNRDFRGRPEIVEWSYEMSWRLARLSELKHSKNEEMIRNYKNAIDQLMPNFVDISADVDLIRLIALPSVMECLQEGFDIRDESDGAVQSTLTHGMPETALQNRFRMLNYQHRMEPKISEFPRDQFYKGEALIDADTVQNRRREQPFDYRGSQPDSIWLNVNGIEKNGYNSKEIEAVVKEVRNTIEWARKNPPLGRNDDTWHIAVLTPYSGQYKGIVGAVQKITGIHDRSFRFNLKEMKNPAPVTLLVSSTDKFQGQEADIVIISLVLTHRQGFLDSPNRMNVALTRARRKRIIVGRHANFLGSRDEMLKEMASRHSGAALIN
jgi:hypothetical protein